MKASTKKELKQCAVCILTGIGIVWCLAHFFDKVFDKCHDTYNWFREVNVIRLNPPTVYQVTTNHYTINCNRAHCDKQHVEHGAIILPCSTNQLGWFDNSTNRNSILYR